MFHLTSKIKYYESPTVMSCPVLRRAGLGLMELEQAFIFKRVIASCIVEVTA